MIYIKNAYQITILIKLLEHQEDSWLFFMSTVLEL